MSIKSLSGRRSGSRIVLSALAFVCLLSGCSEPEVILPGKRESIRSADGTDERAALVASTNESRPISLPAQRNNASWALPWGTPAGRVTHAALNLPLQEVWSVNIGDGDSRRNRITAAPVVAGGRIFTLDAESLVTATSTSGEIVWQTDIIPPRDKSGQATGGGLAFADGRVFVVSGYSTVVALNAATGEIEWAQRLEGSASGAPTVVGGIVYLTSGDDRGWALTADEGRQLWILSASPNASNYLGAPAPAVSDDLAIFAFGAGEVQAVFRRGGLRRWDASVSGQRVGTALGTIGDITGAPVVSGNSVYVGNLSGRTVSLDLNSGVRNWTVSEGAVGRIVPVGNSVFFVSDQNELLRLSAADGERIWSVNLPKFISDRPRRQSAVVSHHGPVLAGGRLHVASDDGLIRSFDPTNGALTASIEIAGGATSAPVVAGGVFYVVSTKGRLHAFR